MIPLKLAATTAILLLYPLAWADSSYQSSTQITGGTLVNMLKNSSMPFMPRMGAAKTATDPKITITAVHGNQKAVVSKDRIEIYDIDKQTVTRIDPARKTYTVMTFDQMRQMIKDMPQKLAEMNAKLKQSEAQRGSSTPPADVTTSSETEVKNPGVSKVVNGLMAEERVITVTTKVTGTSPSPNNSAVTYVTTTDLWIAPEPPEVKEVIDFDVRMYTIIAQGLDEKTLSEQMQAASANAGYGMMFANRPGASDALAEMNKEIAKMQGIRVLEVTSMSTDALPPMPQAPPVPPATSAATPSGGTVAGQIATGTATQTAAGESSKLGVFGNALSNSALSVFHRRKATPAPAAAPPPAPAPAPETTASGANAASNPNTLMVSTTQKSNFSQDPVPASTFQIPAGYKQVQSPNGMF